ncbi:MAG: hypothetical protein BMS9Abin25_0681 [Gammaproteobacteria bacterium]|nr:MAG: hypothetical protein BMS9Abin25_0681 [Gammaproteobacteria bacterium]
MINRSSITLKYREPAVKWINEADPYNDNPGITLTSVNKDRIVYLIREEDADTPDDLKEWIELNYEALFENELDGWYTDESLWPKKRTLKLFYNWFDVECNTVILDTVGSTIIDEEI